MNRHERRALFGAIEEMSKKIVLEPDWELRWDAFSGCMQGAADFGLPQAGELMKEFGGNLAKRVIDRLGAPCVGEIYQSLLYFLSADPAHHAASLAWQFSHQSEVLTLQENNPDIPLLERVGRA